MKNTIYNDIQSLFKSGEIQTIKFSKSGRVFVKFKKEPRLVNYQANENVLQTIIEDAKIRESLEVVTMNPKVKITVSEIEKLNFIANEVKKSLFERFYDSVSYWLGSGKSFAPNELKSFR